MDYILGGKLLGLLGSDDGDQWASTQRVQEGAEKTVLSHNNFRKINTLLLREINAVLLKKNIFILMKRANQTGCRKQVKNKY